MSSLWDGISQVPRLALGISAIGDGTFAMMYLLVLQETWAVHQHEIHSAVPDHQSCADDFTGVHLSVVCRTSEHGG